MVLMASHWLLGSHEDKAGLYDAFCTQQETQQCHTVQRQAVRF